MYLEDLTVGTEIELPEVFVRKEQMLDFAKLYDPFPLHYDDAFASQSRYGKLVAPGVMTFMSVWAKFMETGLLGTELIAGKSTKIEWFKPVFAGDTLTGKVRIANTIVRNMYNGIVEIITDVYNQHGELVLSNLTESVVKRRV